MAAGMLAMVLACAGRVTQQGIDWHALARRTERVRGLDFLDPVAVETVPSARMSGLLRREIEQQLTPDEIRGAERMGVAIGLLPPDADLLGLSSDFGGRATVGFYSPATQRLVIASDATGSGDDLAAVAVHELVHALQDQHTRLIEILLGLWGQDDLAFALGAQIEGDALRAEFFAMSTFGHAVPSVSEIESAYGADEAALLFPDVPRLLRESLFLQYALGYRLVEAAHAEGGDAARDALLAAPALSSEQLLHPEKRLDPAARDWPCFLSFPKPLPVDIDIDGDCVEFGRTTLGELGLGIWLRERGSDAELAGGWDGDRLVVFACAGRLRVVWALVMDDALRAAALEPGLRAGFAGLRSEDRSAASSQGDGGSAHTEEPAVVERSGTRLFATMGLSQAERDRFQVSLRSACYEHLDDFLSAHPGVEERAARVRGRR